MIILADVDIEHVLDGLDRGAFVVEPHHAGTQVGMHNRVASPRQCVLEQRNAVARTEEELEHALEEGIALKVLRSPREFLGDDATGFVKATTLEVMELSEPDASGRRRPVATGETEICMRLRVSCSTMSRRAAAWNS